MPRGVQKNRRGLKKYGFRRCLECRQIFKLNNENFFRNNSKGSSGLDWYCKYCHKIKNRKYYKSTRLKDRFSFLKKYNFTCQYCGRKAPKIELHIDHIIPLSKSGEDCYENKTLSCSECNIGKGNKII